jgi:hypothetical protein
VPLLSKDLAFIAGYNSFSLETLSVVEKKGFVGELT